MNQVSFNKVRLSLAAPCALRVRTSKGKVSCFDF